jgi:hypothetical protein
MLVSIKLNKIFKCWSYLFVNVFLSFLLPLHLVPEGIVVLVLIELVEVVLLMLLRVTFKLLLLLLVRVHIHRVHVHRS